MAEAGKTETEDLLLEIEGKLLRLTVEDLKKFGEYIKIPKEKYDGKSKLKVLRVIRSKMQRRFRSKRTLVNFLHVSKCTLQNSYQTWKERLVRMKQLTIVTKMTMTKQR